MLTFLVTGIGGPAGRNTAALLMERGARVIGTDMRPVPNAALPCLTVPPAAAPEFVPTLAELAQAYRVDILIPTVQEELPFIAANWSLYSTVPALIPSPEAVQRAHDKYETCLALTAAGVATPAFILPSEVSSADDIAQRLGWPCIGKPRIGRGGRGVHLFQRACWAGALGLNDDFVLQAFAPGIEYDVNAFIGMDGRALAIVLEKIELRGGQVGNAVRVQRTQADDVAALALAAGRALGLTGPFDVDVRRLADGLPVVLEVNARFGANIAHAPEILDASLTHLEAQPA